MNNEPSREDRLPPRDEKLLADVFFRVLREVVEPEELKLYCLKPDDFVAFEWRDEDETRMLGIDATLGFITSYEWNGSIAEAMRHTIDMAIHAAEDNL